MTINPKDPKPVTNWVRAHRIENGATLPLDTCLLAYLDEQHVAGQPLRKRDAPFVVLGPNRDDPMLDTPLCPPVDEQPAPGSRVLEYPGAPTVSRVEGAGEAKPECPCFQCKELRLAPGTVQRSMVVCAKCGNKRCPKAYFHGYACNNSNDRDQTPILEAPVAEPPPLVAGEPRIPPLNAPGQPCTLCGGSGKSRGRDTEHDCSLCVSRLRSENQEMRERLTRIGYHVGPHSADVAHIKSQLATVETERDSLRQQLELDRQLYEKDVARLEAERGPETKTRSLVCPECAALHAKPASPEWLDELLDALSDGLTLAEDGIYLGEDAGLLIEAALDSQLTAAKSALEETWLDGWAASFRDGAKKLEKLGLMSDPVRVLTETLERQVEAHSEFIKSHYQPFLDSLPKVTQTCTGEIEEKLRAAESALEQANARAVEVEKERAGWENHFDRRTQQWQVDSDRLESALTEANARAERLESERPHLLEAARIAKAQMEDEDGYVGAVAYRAWHAAEMTRLSAQSPKQAGEPVASFKVGDAIRVMLRSSVYYGWKGEIYSIDPHFPSTPFHCKMGQFHRNFSADDIEPFEPNPPPTPALTSSTVVPDGSTGEGCAVCGKPATCYGSYDGSEPAYACDSCCGHGCEDGECEPVSETKEQP